MPKDNMTQGERAVLDALGSPKKPQGIVFESYRAMRMAKITCDLLVKEYDITKEDCWRLLRDAYVKSFTHNSNPVIQADIISASEGLTRRPDVKR